MEIKEHILFSKKFINILNDDIERCTMCFYELQNFKRTLCYKIRVRSLFNQIVPANWNPTVYSESE